MTLITSVLIKPIVSEKMTKDKRTCAFQIHNDANKKDVMQAIKEFYGITPLSVKIAKNAEKYRMGAKGRLVQKRAPLKKAIVRLPEGETLDFNAFK